MSASDPFTFDDEQTMIRDTVAKFAADTLSPIALDYDEHSKFMQPGFSGMAELGMFGLPVAEDHGGAGMGTVAFVLALEETAAVCSSTARMLLVQAGGVAGALAGVDGADDAMMAAMSGDHGVSLVGRGNGVTASTDGDGVKLTGVAPLVTGGGEAKHVLVIATIEGSKDLCVCWLDTDAAGLTVSAVPALGFRAAAPASMTLENAAVPANRVFARGEAALTIAKRSDAMLAIGSAAIATGFARASIELTKKHAGERIAFGKPLLAQQAVQDKLVACRSRMTAARHMTLHAARQLDAAGVDGEGVFAQSAMARLLAVDVAVDTSDEAIQIHGGYGYVVEYQVEGHYRDAMTLATLDGGAGVLRDALAAELVA